jgi:hypothetical protein
MGSCYPATLHSKPQIWNYIKDDLDCDLVLASTAFASAGVTTIL